MKHELEATLAVVVSHDRRPWRLVSLGPVSFVVALTALAACSSTSPPDTAPGAMSGPTGNDTSNPPAGAAVEPSDPTSDTFDLVLRGVGYEDYLAMMGETSNEIMAAVESEATGERVAWTAKKVSSADDTFELTWPKLLRRGAAYRVAVAAYGRYALHAVDAVSANVVLEIDQQKTAAASDPTWKSAYDMLSTKLALAPGTYEAALPADGTSIRLVVGASGRLATRSIALGCSGATACGRTSVWSNPTCEPSFVRGDDTTSEIDVVRSNESLVAEVSVEGTALRVKGTMKSGTCCSVAIDVLVPRTSAATDSCT